MDTAGKAVLFSGVTVLVSLAAVMLVDSPAFRSMAVGIMLSVIFVLGGDADAAAGGARPTRYPRSIDLSLPWVHQGEHRSARFAAWGEQLWRHPWALGHRDGRRPRRPGRPGVVAGHRHALDQGGAEDRHQPPGLRASCSRRSAPARRARCRSPRPPPTRLASPRALAADPAIAQVTPPQPGASGHVVLLQAVPAPTRPPRSSARDRPPARDAARGPGRRRGRREPRPRGGAREQDAARHRRRPRLGFLLLLVALRLR